MYTRHRLGPLPWELWNDKVIVSSQFGIDVLSKSGDNALGAILRRHVSRTLLRCTARMLVRWSEERNVSIDDIESLASALDLDIDVLLARF